MDIHYQKTVGEVVAQDFRAAAIFEKYGIDFCCKGNIPIDEACERKHVYTEDVMRELKLLLTGSENNSVDYASWSPAYLADYIEQTHHTFVSEKTPVLMRFLDKLCSVHGPRHPELLEVNRLFCESAAELAMHMKKEELILFPRIRKMTAAATGTLQENAITPGMVQGPIAVMMEEHEHEGDRFSKIDALTGHYQPPADACNTYKATYALLQEFENDLHLHIHLENNILFPKAVEMEKELMN
jgi:regulator of cell morphogenesis and NO signaling